MPSNVKAAAATIAALKPRLTAEHDALVELIRTLAELLDGDKLDARSIGSVAAQYRAALLDLREATSDDELDDDDAAFLRSIQVEPVSTGVRNAKKART